MDSDWYGNAADTLFAADCIAPAGYVFSHTDCDDNNPDVNPGTIEISDNGIDDDCDGYIDEFGVGVSEIEQIALALSVFPNPFGGTFIIYLRMNDEANAEATIEVLNLLGQKVHSHQVQVVKGMLQKEIQLKDAATGTYLVKAIINDHLFTTQLYLQK